MEHTIFTNRLCVKIPETSTCSIKGLLESDGLPAGHYHVLDASNNVVGRYVGDYTSAWPHSSNTPSNLEEVGH